MRIGRRAAARAAIVGAAVFTATLGNAGPVAALAPSPRENFNYPTCPSSRIDSPHFSVGGNTILAKAHIICNPTASDQRFLVNGYLGFVSGGTCSPNRPAQGPPTTKWTGKVAELVIRGSSDNTRYVPPLDGPDFRSTGTWVARIKIYFWVNNSEGWTFIREVQSPSRYAGPSCP
jgi:hypothetical protein